MAEIYVIELNMESSNPDENTIVFLRGVFKRNRERYISLEKLDNDDPQRYEFSPCMNVGDVLEDISYPGDAVVIYGDGGVTKCLKGFDRYKGRSIEIRHLDDRKDNSDIDEVVRNALKGIGL